MIDLLQPVRAYARCAAPASRNLALALILLAVCGSKVAAAEDWGDPAAIALKFFEQVSARNAGYRAYTLTPLEAEDLLVRPTAMPRGFRAMEAELFKRTQMVPGMVWITAGHPELVTRDPKYYDGALLRSEIMRDPAGGMKILLGAGVNSAAGHKPYLILQAITMMKTRDNQWKVAVCQSPLRRMVMQAVDAPSSQKKSIEEKLLPPLTELHRHEFPGFRLAHIAIFRDIAINQLYDKEPTAEMERKAFPLAKMKQLTEELLQDPNELVRLEAEAALFTEAVCRTPVFEPVGAAAAAAAPHPKWVSHQPTARRRDVLRGRHVDVSGQPAAVVHRPVSRSRDREPAVPASDEPERPTLSIEAVAVAQTRCRDENGTRGLVAGSRMVGLIAAESVAGVVAEWVRDEVTERLLPKKADHMTIVRVLALDNRLQRVEGHRLATILHEQGRGPALGARSTLQLRYTAMPGVFLFIGEEVNHLHDTVGKVGQSLQTTLRLPAQVDMVGMVDRYVREQDALYMILTEVRLAPLPWAQHLAYFVPVLADGFKEYPQLGTVVRVAGRPVALPSGARMKLPISKTKISAFIAPSDCTDLLKSAGPDCAIGHPHYVFEIGQSGNGEQLALRIPRPPAPSSGPQAAAQKALERCRDRLKRLGLAAVMYQDDYAKWPTSGRLLYPDYTRLAFREEGPHKYVFTCPEPGAGDKTPFYDISTLSLTSGKEIAVFCNAHSGHLVVLYGDTRAAIISDDSGPVPVSMEQIAPEDLP